MTTFVKKVAKTNKFHITTEQIDVKLSFDEMKVIAALYNHSDFKSMLANAEEKKTIQIDVDELTDEKKTKSSRKKVAESSDQSSDQSSDDESDSSDFTKQVTCQELKLELKKLGLSCSGTKSDLIERVMEGLLGDKVTVAGLKGLLAGWKLKVSGVKSELIERVLIHLIKG